MAHCSEPVPFFNRLLAREADAMATLPPNGFLSRPWLVSGASLAALAALVVLLRAPWEAPGGSAETLRLYCAAGMTAPMQEVIDAYRAETGVEVQATYDGSGKLLSTITVLGGRGDLYLPADAEHLAKAEKLGLIRQTMPLAVLHPVLAVSPATQNALRAAGKPVASLDDLFRGDLKVAIANPELASIGQLTREMLQPTGQWKRLTSDMASEGARVSMAGTVLEVAGAIKNRQDCIGVVWDAVAKRFGLETVDVPEFAGHAEKIQIGVLTSSRDPAAAAAFARYLTAPANGLSIFRKHGFNPPEIK
jgi:molybdate transport system substrate-binding protein